MDTQMSDCATPLNIRPEQAPRAHPRFDKRDLGQISLVLQGGGALGAYQAGVYQALDEAGVEPDWVIGTSIGAINAGIIAGNRPENRLPRLREFWSRMRHGPAMQMLAGLPGWGTMAANAMTVFGGLPGFFRPNTAAFLGLPLTPETAGY